MLAVIKNIGKYMLMLWIVFSRPEKWSVFRQRLFDEIQLIGLNSIPIVALMSVFMGGNSLNYLVMPKILGAVLFFPVLIIFSMGLSLVGGWLSLILSGQSPLE